MCCLLILAWLSRKSAALLPHVMCRGVDSSILDGFSTEFDVDSSMESIWTVPWNPYGIVHEFTV